MTERTILDMALEALRALLDDILEGGLCTLCRHKVSPLALHHDECPVPRAVAAVEAIEKMKGDAAPRRKATEEEFQAELDRVYGPAERACALRA